jgi:hypothetical protein
MGGAQSYLSKNVHGNSWLAYNITSQDLQSSITNKHLLFLLPSIKLPLKLLNGNGFIGRHAVILGRFLNLLLHINPLVSDRWIDDLCYQNGISEKENKAPNLICN